MTAVQFRNAEVRLSTALAEAAGSVRGQVMTLRDLLAQVGEQGLLVFSAILALPFMIPVSLPFMSTAFGLPMLLIGLAVIQGKLPWIPDRVLDRELPSSTVQQVLVRGSRIALRFEHLVRPRLLALTASPLVNSVHGVAIVVTVLLLMAPLPFVPLANTLPAIAIILLCLGIAERDGLLIVLGYVVATVSFVYVVWLLWLVFEAGMNSKGVADMVHALLGRITGG